MLKTSKLTEKLKSNFFFKKAPGAAVTAGLRKGRLKEIPEGDIIFQNGDPSEGVYLILYGLVKIKIKTKTGAKIITKAAGDFFGEREVMESIERTSTAIAEIDTELYLVDKSTFLDLAYNDKEIKINVKINLAKTYDLSKEGAELILVKNDPSLKSGSILSPGTVPSTRVVEEETKVVESFIEETPEKIFEARFTSNAREELEEEFPDDEIEEEDLEEEFPDDEIEEEDLEEEFPDDEIEEEDLEEEFPDDEIEEEDLEEEFPDYEIEEEEKKLEKIASIEDVETESDTVDIPEFNFNDSFDDPEFETEEIEFNEPWSDEDEVDFISDREREDFESTPDEISAEEELAVDENGIESENESEEDTPTEDATEDVEPPKDLESEEQHDEESVKEVIPVITEAQYEKSMEEIETLRKSINLISGICRANTPRDIYDALKDDLADLIDADEFMMFVFDGGFLASVGDHHDEGTNFAIREKIAYELITMQEPVTLFDLDKSGIMDGMEHMDEDQIPSSLLYYPLIETEKRVIGCFLFFTSNNGRFSHTDVMKIEDFARSASGILEKITIGQTPVTFKYEDLEKYTAFFGSEIKMAVETILSVSETLDRGKLAEKVRYGFDIIRERASGLKGFLDSIQYFLGKLSGFSKQPYLVSELLDDFLVKISESAKQREVTLLRKYDSDIVMFFNRELFIHALTLITQNSFDAMPNGGKIYFSTSANESNILISIRDTGTGVHPDLREKIFEPFFSIGKKGVGLGLPISNKIIKEHGGFIYLESSRTQGTEIIIALPV